MMNRANNCSVVMPMDQVLQYFRRRRSQSQQSPNNLRDDMSRMRIVHSVHDDSVQDEDEEDIQAISPFQRTPTRQHLRSRTNGSNFPDDRLSDSLDSSHQRVTATNPLPTTPDRPSSRVIIEGHRGLSSAFNAPTTPQQGLTTTTIATSTPTRNDSTSTTTITGGNVNFRQFLSQHNWPSTPPPPSTNRDVHIVLEQLMQKSIAIRRSQIPVYVHQTSNPGTPTPSGRPTEPKSHDFGSFLNLVAKHPNVDPLIVIPELAKESPKQTPSLTEVEVCVICLVNPKEYCIPKCNHLCLCQECSDMFKPSNGDVEETASNIHNKCPLCRKLIQGLPFKIYR